MGLAQEQMQDPLFGKVGNTGAAYPLMLLISALEESADGDLLLTASYGDGSDVLSFRVNEGIEALRDRLGVSRQVESKAVLPSYETYARWRDVWTSDAAARRPAPASPSVTALWRESDQNIRLYGLGATSVAPFNTLPRGSVPYARLKTIPSLSGCRIRGGLYSPIPWTTWRAPPIPPW